MDIIQKELDIIKKELVRNFVDPILDNELTDFIVSGSKFIRSSLAILYLKSQGVEISEKVYTILSVGELLHNASLLHDDVLDEAETRRNKITIAKNFSPKVSILAGDYLLTYAIEKLMVLEDYKILEIFKNTTKQMVQAEIKQYFLRKKLPLLEEYLLICKGKTASLFSGILESCALVSGMDSIKAKSFGEIFGLCFQIKNDLNILSANLDKKNGIYTAQDIIGIEKTTDLLDNYKEEMKTLIKDFSENTYKKRLEDLIDLL